MDICTDGAKASVGVAAGASVSPKETTPSPRAMGHPSLTAKGMAVSLRNILGEAVETKNFITSGPLSTGIFNTL